MGFSSRLKAHRHLLTLESLKFVVAYLGGGQSIKQAAIESGIPETYASRQGQWMMKLPLVRRALETEVDDRDLRKLNVAIANIEDEMRKCREILGLADD